MKSILSFQSSVSFGAVGNTMANAVMAELGHHLCRMDTIQLIAHPGYGYRAGGSLPDSAFKAMLEGLTDFQLEPRIDSIMTGYMGTEGQVQMIAEAIAKIHAIRPDLDILVDPAFGDHGKLYVDEKIAHLITQHLIPLAQVITPNFFEFCHITGEDIVSPEDIIKAGQRLIAKNQNLRAIAVTGCALHKDKNISDIWIEAADSTSFDAPILTHNEKGMSGGGDLFAALLIGFRMLGHDWRDAFAHTAKFSRSIINGADKNGATDIDLELLKDVLKDRA